MRKQYDDFTQLKPKDMSKAISDMTFQYINPDTQAPTKVPATHYEKILDRVTEKYMVELTSRQFLVIMYNQLSNLKKEDEKYFNQALLCMDLGLNPKDLRYDERVSIDLTTEFINEKKVLKKKEYHFLSEDIISNYYDNKNDPELQSNVIKASNEFEKIEDSILEIVKNEDEIFDKKDIVIKKYKVETKFLDEYVYNVVIYASNDNGNNYYDTGESKICRDRQELDTYLSELKSQGITDMRSKDREQEQGR